MRQWFFFLFTRRSFCELLFSYWSRRWSLCDQVIEIMFYSMRKCDRYYIVKSYSIILFFCSGLFKEMRTNQGSHRNYSEDQFGSVNTGRSAGVDSKGRARTSATAADPISWTRLNAAPSNNLLPSLLYIATKRNSWVFSSRGGGGEISHVGDPAGATQWPSSRTLAGVIIIIQQHRWEVPGKKRGRLLV